MYLFLTLLPLGAAIAAAPDRTAPPFILGLAIGAGFIGLSLLAMRIYTIRTKEVDEIVYDNARNPFFFDNAGNEYSTWTPRLLRAAYNYRYATLGVGAYAHNGLYTLQLLYDSLNDLGVNTSAMTRPEAESSKAR
jgi:hypothetical protein